MLFDHFEVLSLFLLPSKSEFDWLNKFCENMIIGLTLEHTEYSREYFFAIFVTKNMLKINQNEFGPKT